jgi:CheY-like chemotaxis protein
MTRFVAAEACPKPADPSREGQPGILLVDDSPVVRSKLGEVLRGHGFAVWTAASGSQAVEVYRLHLDAIALVLLDQCMPGLDGSQTLDELRRLNPRVRCCFLTGAGEDDDALLQRGAETVLRKPMEPNDVARALARILT